jgi:hypothetical protein
VSQSRFFHLPNENRMTKAESKAIQSGHVTTGRTMKQSPWNIRVGRSSAGLGIFAVERIPKGAPIIEYWGERISEEEANKRGNLYLFEVSDTVTIDGSARTNTARYFNCSCVPNAEAILEDERVFIWSTRVIEAGEEIVYNYGQEYFEEYLSKGRCRCAKHQKESV